MEHTFVFSLILQVTRSFPPFAFLLLPHDLFQCILCHRFPFQTTPPALFFGFPLFLPPRFFPLDSQNRPFFWCPIVARLSLILPFSFVFPFDDVIPPALFADVLSTEPYPHPPLPGLSTPYSPLDVFDVARHFHFTSPFQFFSFNFSPFPAPLQVNKPTISSHRTTSTPT